MFGVFVAKACSRPRQDVKKPPASLISFEYWVNGAVGCVAATLGGFQPSVSHCRVEFLELINDERVGTGDSTARLALNYLIPGIRGVSLLISPEARHSDLL